MNTILEYITEKLKLSKNTIIDKADKVQEILDIIEETCNYYHVDGGFYLNMIDNTENRTLVNDPNDCNAISLSFKNSMIKEIEEAGKKYKSFLNELKKELEKRLKKYNIKEIIITSNNISGALKLHIIL